MYVHIVLLIVFPDVIALHRGPSNRSLPTIDVKEVIMDPTDPIKSRNESLVPLLKRKIRSYAGYFNIPFRNDSKLFAWFFPNSNLSVPLIVWLQGQPGISSLYGLFEEHGPFQIDPITMELTMREYTLTHSYHVLYLDPETNCGFSYSSVKGEFYNSMRHIPRQIYETLGDFFRIFFEFKQNPVYLAGESSSYRILPQVVQHITYDVKNQQINLKGILIGGGVFHEQHALHYVKELFQLGIIDTRTVNKLNREEEIINALLRASYPDKAFDHIGSIVVGLRKSGYQSIYDVRDPLANLHSDVTYIVKDPEIKKALHVGDRPFKKKKQALSRDILLPVSHFYTDILSHTRILLYNGQFDFFASYAESEMFMSVLPWRGTYDFYSVNRKIWKEDDELIGYWKTVGNMTHVLIRNAGHWVASTQPRAFYNLVNKFIENKFD